MTHFDGNIKGVILLVQLLDMHCVACDTLNISSY